MDAQRDAAAKEAEANKMANGGMDGVEWERKSMLSICRSLNVEMVEMNPDGHWSGTPLLAPYPSQLATDQLPVSLFAAVAHQLNLQPSRYMKVRFLCLSFGPSHTNHLPGYEATRCQGNISIRQNRCCEANARTPRRLHCIHSFRRGVDDHRFALIFLSLSSFLDVALILLSCRTIRKVL